MRAWRAAAGWLPAVVLVPVAVVGVVRLSESPDAGAATRNVLPAELGTTWVYAVSDHDEPSGTRTSQVVDQNTLLGFGDDVTEAVEVTRDYTRLPRNRTPFEQQLLRDPGRRGGAARPGRRDRVDAGARTRRTCLHAEPARGRWTGLRRGARDDSAPSPHDRVGRRRGRGRRTHLRRLRPLGHRDDLRERGSAGLRGGGRGVDLPGVRHRADRRDQRGVRHRGDRGADRVPRCGRQLVRRRARTRRAASRAGGRRGRGVRRASHPGGPRRKDRPAARVERRASVASVVPGGDRRGRGGDGGTRRAGDGAQPGDRRTTLAGRPGLTDHGHSPGRR